MLQKRIKFFRQWAGLSQTDLSKKTNNYVKQKKISNIEHGTMPRIDDIQVLAIALGVRLTDLFLSDNYIHPKVKCRYLKKYGNPPDEALEDYPEIKINF